MNDFYRDLEYSLELNDSNSLDEFYKANFPQLEKIIEVKDLDMQKLGIDKILVLANGKRLLIDEKKRRKDYGDILLEEYSNFELRKVGWLGRDKHTDYIVYWIRESNTVYLLPFILLQKAWVSNYYTWLKDYGRKFASNNYYRTSNIPIPKDILLESIRNEMVRSIVL